MTTNKSDKNTNNHPYDLKTNKSDKNTNNHPYDNKQIRQEYKQSSL